MNISFPDADQYALVGRNLDGIFASLLDGARSGTGHHAWPEAIGLMALRFIAGDPGGPDRWAQVVEPRGAGQETTHLIRHLAANIEVLHPELDGVFSRALLSGLERFDSSLLREWTFKLSQLSRITVTPSDFGHWANTTLARLATQASEAGEASTPPSIARLMVEIADAPEKASVFDPCCGLGMILGSAVERAHREGQLLEVFGQEISPLSWALCKLRLFLMGLDVRSIRLGDSLREPAFVEDGRVRAFDRVFCDFPVGISLRDPGFPYGDPYDRFVFGLPGRGNADSAFVQHAVASMKPDGRAVVLLSHGFLFRGGADGRVREGLVGARLVQAVIGLPAKLKFGTAIETAIVIFGKNSREEILFIDASRLQPNLRGKAELSAKTIQKIVELFRSPASVPEISKIVSVKELIGESNLLPRRHISSVEETAPSFDIDGLREQVRALEATADHTAKQMDHLIQEITGPPDGDNQSGGASENIRSFTGTRRVLPNPDLMKDQTK